MSFVKLQGNLPEAVVYVMIEHRMVRRLIGAEILKGNTDLNTVVQHGG